MSSLHTFGIASLLLLGSLAIHENDRAEVAHPIGPEAPAGQGDVPEGLAASDWSSIREAYEAGRHAAFAVEGGYRARNPGQRWTTRFDGRGFTVEPDGEGWSWGLELRSYGVDGSQVAVAKPLAVRADGHRVSYDWDANLTEWYVNDRRGLEHGYTVQARPDHGEGPLRLDLAIRGGLTPMVSEDARGVRFGDDTGSVMITYSGLAVVDADGRTLGARLEGDADGLRLWVDDAEARYPLTIDPIAQQAYLKASNAEASDTFGWSVSASGNTVVVGSLYESSNATGVNGDGSNNLAGRSGAVYVFVRNGATWSQQAFLKASNTETDDYFGTSVSISGDTLVVGAAGSTAAGGEDSSATGVNGNQADNGAMNSGAAYVFVRTGTTWSQEAYLKASNTGSNDYFGYSVAVSGDTVIVGAVQEASNANVVNGNQSDDTLTASGAAYVFVRSGINWSQQAYLKASNSGAFDYFGSAVTVSGNTAVVGALFESSNATGVNGNQASNSSFSSGAAYVFVRSGTLWSQQAYLKASNTGAGDNFGVSVSLSGDTLLVGANLEDSNANGVNGDQANNSLGNSGAAYVFTRSGIAWSQQAYLKASNPGQGQQFGLSGSLSGNTAVIGASLEDSNASGVNGDQTNHSLGGSGAAYVFVRGGATWSQHAYLKASNPGFFDSFGHSVAISGDVVVSGAPGESSNATGVNGAQFNDLATVSGAAYVFDLATNSGVASYGAGTPGCAGTHTLGVNHAPMIGSPAFRFLCDNAPPASLGLGILSDVQDLAGSDPFGIGVILHVNLLTATEVNALDFFSDATGHAETLDLLIPNNAMLIGKTYYLMALWSWTSCSLPPYNLSTSRGLAVTVQAP